VSRKRPAGKQKESAQTNVDWKAIGGSGHWVAIGPDRDPEPVRCCGCFTADLHEMGHWLVWRRAVPCRWPTCDVGHAYPSGVRVSPLVSVGN
jgi:hypothetical protein